jgi:hypothetical protein
MSARITAGSRFKLFLSFVLVDVRCVLVPPEVRLPQVEYGHYLQELQGLPGTVYLLVVCNAP